MASALAGGMVKAGLIKRRQLVASDVVPAAGKAFAKTTGGKVLKIIPPLTIPKSDLISGLEILTESVRSVMEKAA